MSGKTKLPGAKSSDLSSRLKVHLTKAFYNRDKGRDRVRNPAIRFDALEVFDFPADLVYMWVPAPGETAPPAHTSSEMAQRRAEMVQRGWNYYPSDEFGREGDTPFMPEWSDDHGRVRSQDHWLVYTDREFQDGKRQANIDKWNRKHEARKDNTRDEGARGATVREYKREPLTERELLGELHQRAAEAGYETED